MGVEVDQGDRPVDRVMGAQQGVGDEVVAAQAEQGDAGLEDAPSVASMVSTISLERPKSKSQSP